VTPPGVVVVQVLDGVPLDDVEDEHTLRKQFYFSQCINFGGGDAYEADGRGGDDPGELPEEEGIVADHVLDAVVEAVDAERPRDGDALEEDEEEQAEAAYGVRVEQLEHVHAALRTHRFNIKLLNMHYYILEFYWRQMHDKKFVKKKIVWEGKFEFDVQNKITHVCDAGEADQVREDANERDEQLLTTTQQLRVFVHHGSNETFHCTELEIKLKHDLVR
jgi:hypothetical protein